MIERRWQKEHVNNWGKWVKAKKTKCHTPRNWGKQTKFEIVLLKMTVKNNISSPKISPFKCLYNKLVKWQDGIPFPCFCICVKSHPISLLSHKWEKVNWSLWTKKKQVFVCIAWEQCSILSIQAFLEEMSNLSNDLRNFRLIKLPNENHDPSRSKNNQMNWLRDIQLWCFTLANMETQRGKKIHKAALVSKNHWTDF